MGISERKEREKVQRQELIVEAAEKVFLSKGFESSTMDDVGKQAELSKGTLYLYFKSKEELLLAIHHRSLIGLKVYNADLITSKLNGLQIIDEIGKRYVEYCKQNPAFLFTMDLCESSLINKCIGSPVFQNCHAESQGSFSIMLNAFDKGIKDGSIRSSINTKIVAMQLWCCLTGIIKTFSANKKDLIGQTFNIFQEDVLKSYFDMVEFYIKAK
jgi:TetR/AcrR family transcriptional regulator